MSTGDTLDTLKISMASQKELPNVKPEQTRTSNSYISAYNDTEKGYYTENSVQTNSYSDFGEQNSSSVSGDLFGNEKLDLGMEDGSNSFNFMRSDADDFSKYNNGVISYLSQKPVDSSRIDPQRSQTISQDAQIPSSNNVSYHRIIPSTAQESETPAGNDFAVNFTPPFTIDLEMVRRTMKGVNEALGVDLSGTEVTETALQDFPNYDAIDGEQKENSSSKSEMSHVRLISDACGHIVVSVAKAVIEAARESANENHLRGLPLQPPKPPIRKKRGGVLGFKELANRANLSPWHFHRVFRFVTGVTPKAYGEALWEYMMIQCKFDLSNEELNIAHAIDRKGLLKDAGKISNTSSSSTGSPQSPVQNQTASSASYGNYSSSLKAEGAGTGVIPSNTKQGMANIDISGNVSSLDYGERNEQKNESNPSSSMNSPPMNANSNALNNAAQASLVPLAGSVAPGRVRKAGSRSRGASSRSRNRSQTQSQILSSLSIEPTVAQDSGNINRGRSFSRVVRPNFLEPTMPYYPNGSAINDSNGLSNGNDTHIMDNDKVKSQLSGSGTMQMIDGLNGEFASPKDIMMPMGVPDLNNLTLQQIETPLGSVDDRTGYNMNMGMDFNSNPYYVYGNADSMPYDNQETQITSQIPPQINVQANSNSSRSENIDRVNQQLSSDPNVKNQKIQNKDDHGMALKSGMNRNVDNSVMPSPNNGGMLDLNGNIIDSPQDGDTIGQGMSELYTRAQYNDAMNFMNNSTVNRMTESQMQGSAQEALYDFNTQSGQDTVNSMQKYTSGVMDNDGSGNINENQRSNNQQTGVINPRGTGSNSMPPPSQRFGDLSVPRMNHHHSESFHSIENPLSSIRENFQPPGVPSTGGDFDNLKFDEYEDLPENYFSNNADQVGEDDINSDPYLSVFIGDDEPPMASPFNTEERNDFSYHY